MKELIQEKLMEIRKEHEITILYACESGSRGWHFPSPDSDYDVRFIYLRPVNYYLSVVDRSYDLIFPINSELDLGGWDLRKALQLLLRSNVTPFEWLQSPIVYEERPGFREKLWKLCLNYYSQRSNIHHYLGIANGAMESIVTEDQIQIKKLFYILRPLLAAKWCLEKSGIAPMSILPLLDLIDPQVKNEILELIDQKATAAEKFSIQIPAHLLNFIKSEFERISQASNTIARTQFNSMELDSFFRDTISTYDDSRA